MLRSYQGIAPRIHDSCYIDESAQIIGDVEIGENSSVWMNAVIRGDVFAIKIGKCSNVQDCSVLHGMRYKYGVTLGDWVADSRDEDPAGLGLGYGGAAVIFGGLLVLTYLLYRLTGVSRVLRKEMPKTKIVVCEPADAALLSSGAEQARNADHTPAKPHPAFKPHPMQGWTPDFIPHILGEATDEKGYYEILTVPGP